jgi:DNA-binding transcriptional LysR family regulator
MVARMEWLNYHHLLYFWTVVRTGSVAAASEELRLAPPTISVQIRRLEEQLGEKLLRRSGRRLLPTEMGQAVFRYADEIFSLGRELLDMVRGRPTERPMKLIVGVVDVMPKYIAMAHRPRTPPGRARSNRLSRGDPRTTAGAALRAVPRRRAVRCADCTRRQRPGV